MMRKKTQKNEMKNSHNGIETRHLSPIFVWVLFRSQNNHNNIWCWALYRIQRQRHKIQTHKWQCGLASPHCLRTVCLHTINIECVHREQYATYSMYEYDSPICDMFFFCDASNLERSTLIAFHFNPSSGCLLVDLNWRHITSIEHCTLYFIFVHYACIDSISFAYFIPAAAVFVDDSMVHLMSMGRNYFSLTLFISGLDIR